MKQEGIRFGSPLIKQQWENMEKMETAVNYLDVMLTTASQQSLGTEGEVKYLQVYMRGNELLSVTLNSKSGGTIAISDYAKGVDPILLNMLVMTVDTYIKDNYLTFLKDNMGIDLVEELNIKELEEEVQTPEPANSVQQPTHSILDRALADAQVTAIIKGKIYLDDVLPLRIKPIVLDTLRGNDLMSQEEWEKEVKKLEHRSALEKVVDDLTKRWNETTKPKDTKVGEEVTVDKKQLISAIFRRLDNIQEYGGSGKDAYSAVGGSEDFDGNFGDNLYKKSAEELTAIQKALGHIEIYNNRLCGTIFEKYKEKPWRGK